MNERWQSKLRWLCNNTKKKATTDSSSSDVGSAARQNFKTRFASHSALPSLCLSPSLSLPHNAGETVDKTHETFAHSRLADTWEGQADWGAGEWVAVACAADNRVWEVSNLSLCLSRSFTQQQAPLCRQQKIKFMTLTADGDVAAASIAATEALSGDANDDDGVCYCRFCIVVAAALTERNLTILSNCHSQRHATIHSDQRCQSSFELALSLRLIYSLIHTYIKLTHTHIHT